MDLAELRSLFLFHGLSDDQLGELLGAAEEMAFGPGDVLFREREPAVAWWVLLEGTVELVRWSNHEESVVGELARPGVWAGGFQAWTESAGYLATGRGATAGRVMVVPSEVLGVLVRSWFPFGVHMIEGFFSTVRNMEAMARARDSLVALGTLAAGLAHEINNPASAAARAADSLQETCKAVLASLVVLAEHQITPSQFVAIDALRQELDARPALLDPLVVGDREEELIDWLDEHDIDESWRIAPTLAASVPISSGASVSTPRSRPAPWDRPSTGWPRRWPPRRCCPR